MTRREQNKAARRARIADAARALFVEHGFEGTTIRAIAHRAGVGTGTVPLHFDSKADLLVGLFVDDLEAVIAAQTASLPAGTLREQLLHLLSGFLETYARQPDLYRVFVKESMFAQGPQAQRYDRVSAQFVGTLADVIASHRNALRPEADPGFLALQTFGLYLFQVAMFLRQPEPAVAPAREAIGALLDALFAPFTR